MSLRDYTPQQIEEILQAFFDVAGTRQYIGARYVPVFGHGGESPIEWDGGVEAYEPLSIVYHVGETYTSRRYVPAGVDITDTDYWVVTANYNAQMEQYRQEVLSFSDRIDGAYDAVDSLREQVADDYVPFPDSLHYSKYGTEGQVLNTLGDGTTKWDDPVIVTSDIAGPLIDNWLDDHPEATTTIQDGAVTTPKFAANAVTKPKMSVSGVPIELYAIMEYLNAAISYVSKTSYEPTLMQGTYYNDMVLRENTTQVTTRPIRFPTGTRINVKNCTLYGDASPFFIARYHENSYMSGTYTREIQTNVFPGSNYVTESDKYYCIGAYNSEGITPSDVSIEIELQFNNDYDRNLLSKSFLKVITTESTDVNDFTDFGGYSVDNTYTNVPSDMISNGILHSLMFSNTRRLQLISVGGDNPQLYFRTWKYADGQNSFGPWSKLFPHPQQVSETDIKLKYVSSNNYDIDLGIVKLRLYYLDDSSIDAHLWNVNRPRLSSDNTQLDSGDIIGPIKVDGTSDHIFGIHGSATTTTFKVYADGTEVTLGSDTDLTCKSLVIMMHDEGRNPDDPTEHLFDRDVTLTFTRDTMHGINTIKNVSGNALQIINACNGGLIACKSALLNAISTSKEIHVGPYTSTQAADHNITSTTIALDGCNITARNIIGHELSTYEGVVQVYADPDGRNKVYFFTMLDDTLPDGDVLYGEFEYTFK